MSAWEKFRVSLLVFILISFPVYFGTPGLIRLFNNQTHPFSVETVTSSIEKMPDNAFYVTYQNNDIILLKMVTEAKYYLLIKDKKDPNIENIYIGQLVKPDKENGTLEVIGLEQEIPLFPEKEKKK